MSARRIVPFPEFERWRWNGDRDKPKTTLSIKHAIPEPDPPPDHGITYEQYRDDVAKWSDEKLCGVLACLEDNIRINTMPIAMEKALREAKAARAEGLENHRAEYMRRNKLHFDSLESETKKRERAEALEAARLADPEAEEARLKFKAQRLHKEATLRHSDNLDALGAAL